MLSKLPERVMMLWVPEFDEASIDGDAAKDRERRWEHALRAIEHLIPEVEPLRSGWCAMRARGPARYYGGEAEAASALAERLSELGCPEYWIGIANGRFAAEQAVRSMRSPGSARVETDAASGIRIVTAEETAALLDPLPISRATDEELGEVLHSLGIRTLGALAKLPETAVRERFGAAGAAAQRRARGMGPPHAAEVQPRAATVDLSVRIAFEPPLESTDQLAFACVAHAERLLRDLVSRGLVCTELYVELVDDTGSQHGRRWAHPGNFSVADVVNRVRWQADSMCAAPERNGEEHGGAGIAAVRITPARTARAAEHEPGLWNTAPDERIHHQLSRVQSVLGHRGVGTGLLTGGRLSLDRQRLLPWGEAARSGSRDSPLRPRTGPWPGRLPGPAPNAVFQDPPPAKLLDASGTPIGVGAPAGSDPGGDGLSADPARLSVSGTILPASIRAWSSPWPLRERWWAGGTARYRLQILLDDGDAWLLRFEWGRGWTAEARYV